MTLLHYQAEWIPSDLNYGSNREGNYLGQTWQLVFALKISLGQIIYNHECKKSLVAAFFQVYFYLLRFNWTKFLLQLLSLWRLSPQVISFPCSGHLNFLGQNISNPTYFDLKRFLGAYKLKFQRPEMLLSHLF